MQRIGLISLLVRDYDEAIAFYVGVLGFRLIEDYYLDDQAKRWVVVAPNLEAQTQECSTTGLLLARASNPQQAALVGVQTGGRVMGFLYTDDFQRDYVLYQSRGVEFVRGPDQHDYGIVAVFKDLYGNLWDLIEPCK